MGRRFESSRWHIIKNRFFEIIKQNIWIILVILLAFIVRVYQIDSLPYGLHVDEASWGYNAYSILKTGKDEHGQLLPLIFKASGDQKLPAFIYFMVPFVKIFDLNNFAVRLPAVIIGTLLVLVIYFLLREFKFSKNLSLIGALIVAVSPWPIFLSRIFGYDSGIGLLFYSLGLLLFMVSFRTKKKDGLLWSVLFFGLTWYSYIAYRLVTPLTLLALIFIYLRKKGQFEKSKWWIGFLFILITLPLLYKTIVGNASSRFKQVSITPFIGIVAEINENRYFCTEKLPLFICKVLDNKAEHLIRNTIYRYVQALSPEYLFMRGESGYLFLNVKHYGLFYFFLMPFYIAGLISYLVKLIRKTATKNDQLILLGLLLSPLACLIVSEPQKIRLSPLFPFLIIVITKGIELSVSLFRKLTAKKIFLYLFQLILLFNTLLFMFDFLVIHIHKEDLEYQGHFIDLFNYLKTVNKDHEIYIRSVGEPIIFYAFINKTNPHYFQRNVKRFSTNELGFSYTASLGNIHKTDLSAGQVACLLKNKQKGIYVTNENLVNTGGFKKILKTIDSENKVHHYHFIYSYADFDYSNSKCSN